MINGDKEKEFQGSVTEYTDQTLGHYDNFNEVHQALINNDAVLKRMIEDLYIKKTQVTIAHNLGEYPIARAMMPQGYGHDGFGEGTFGDETARLQIRTIIEYTNENTIVLHLAETFEGAPSVTKVDDYHYNIRFSEQTWVDVKLIS